MDNWLIAILLGIIEGITEFLPISSTGHLIIANALFSFTGNFAALFDIVIQTGAIFAVLIYFRKSLFFAVKDPKEKKQTLLLWRKILICVLPIIILGFLFGDLIQKYLFTPFFVAWMLLIGGILLLWIEKNFKTQKTKNIHEITFKTALIIGLFQCFALLPGFSRAGATIIGALVLGVERKTATLFSFFVAIPVLIGASIYSLFLYFQNGFFLTINEIFLLVLGFLVSFIVAFLVIKWFITFISKHDFTFFGLYRIVLGIIILILIIL